jgi:DNA-binding NarL/FixJ family response regulator
VQRGVCCSAVYANAEEVFRRAAPKPNELWLLNRALPDMSGDDCRERLKQLVPEFCGVLYSIYEDSDRLFLAPPGGASAYLLTRTPPDRMLAPVVAEASNKLLPPAELLAHVKFFFAKILAFGGAAEVTPELAKLTVREHEILELLSKGYVDKEIASRLGISGWTVHGHVKNIFEKLGVHTRTEAAVKFLQK